MPTGVVDINPPPPQPDTATTTTTCNCDTTTGSTSTDGLTIADFDTLSDAPDRPDNENIVAGRLAGKRGGLLALAGNDTVRGSITDEIMNGNLGQDSLLGAGGNDLLRGGKDNDQLYGDDGNDTLNGNIGNDLVVGGVGNDMLHGGQNSDVLVGSDGDDTLSGDLDRDLLIGGNNNDRFVLLAEGAVTDTLQADLIVDFSAPDDRILLTQAVQSTDRTFTTVQLQLDNVFDVIQNFQGSTGAGLSGITSQSLDPNGDEMVQGILIGNKANGTFLGIVLNATEADVRRRIEDNPISLIGPG